MSSDHTIKEYLLGGLSEEERWQFEERLFVDASFFEQVRIVESELIDMYIEGNLSEKERFVTHFLATPQQRQKLGIAIALHKKVSETETAVIPGAAGHSRKRLSWPSRLLYTLRARVVATGLKQNG